MNTDTNRADDPDPDDLDGLAASLDHLRLWCESEGPATVPAGNDYRRLASGTGVRATVRSRSHHRRWIWKELQTVPCESLLMQDPDRKACEGAQGVVTAAHRLTNDFEPADPFGEGGK
jgi:hypothetical protein